MYKKVFKNVEIRTTNKHRFECKTRLDKDDENHKRKGEWRETFEEAEQDAVDHILKYIGHRVIIRTEQREIRIVEM